MKKFYLLLILLLLPLALADNHVADNELVEESTTSEDITTEEFIQYASDTLTPLAKKASILVSGVFGLYLILISIRVYYERKKVRLLMDIRYNLDQQNRNLHLPTSRARRTIFERFVDYSFSRTKDFASLSIRKIRRKKHK